MTFLLQVVVVCQLALVPAAATPQTARPAELPAAVQTRSSGVGSLAAATPVGLLRVTTKPAVPARILIDGTVRSDWGVGPIQVPAGSHEVCFTAVPGFVTPPCATVNVTEGATTTHEGAFARLGLLKAEVAPAGLPATVFVDGTPRDEYGLFAYTEPGAHRVCWGDVPGYQAPACQDVTVAAGAQATVSGSFTASPSPTPGPAPSLGTFGYLRVTSTPAVPSRIVVDDIPRSDFGIGPMKISAGDHKVCFTDVPGYGTPACQTVTVTAGASKTVNGAFARLGSLKVEISPAGLPAEIVVDNIVRDRYGLYAFIEAGTYQVCATNLTGYTTPPCASAAVTAATLTTISLTYDTATPPPTTTVPSTTTTVAPTTTTAPSTTTTTPTAGVQFSATFDTASDFTSRFITHAGDYVDSQGHKTSWLIDCCSWVDTVKTMHGDHDDMCNGPDTARTIDITDPTRYFWHCAPGGDPAKGHVMTGFNTTGYAIIAFSPNQTLNDVKKVCWDVNATEEGGGKWTNMVIIPDSLYQRFAPRLDYVTNGFNTPNAPGDFNIQASDHPGTSVWGIKDFRGTQSLFIGDDVVFYSGDTSYTTTDKATRYRHCVEETSPSTSKLTVQRPGGGTSTYTLPSGIPDGPVRVIFQDDMYDPPKRDGYNPSNVTWHWDNIVIA